MDYNFRFNVGLWRNATIPSDFTVPPDADVVLTLDPSWTAEPHSDESGFVVTCKYIVDDLDYLVLMHSTAGRWKGMLLVVEALRLIRDYHPVKFELEKIPGNDLFVDALYERAEKIGVSVPPIFLINPRNTKDAKAQRIMRLNDDLLTREPPALQIVNGSHVRKLFAEVENWVPKKGNHGGQDNLLDCLSMAAGFR